jgi:hypothetical protein
MKHEYSVGKVLESSKRLEASEESGTKQEHHERYEEKTKADE